MQEAIAAAKGQIRAINLNEQDKLNTSAQIDFDVPAEDRAKIDELLEELGEITGAQHGRACRPTRSRPSARSAIGSRCGTSPACRRARRYTLQAVSLDVPAGYRKLQEAVAQAKGHVRVGQLNEQDKLNISAQFDFDVPTTEKRRHRKAARGDRRHVLAQHAAACRRTRSPPTARSAIG